MGEFILAHSVLIFALGGIWLISKLAHMAKLGLYGEFRYHAGELWSFSCSTASSALCLHMMGEIVFIYLLSKFLKYAFQGCIIHVHGCICKMVILYLRHLWARNGHFTLSAKGMDGFSEAFYSIFGAIQVAQCKWRTLDSPCTSVRRSDW